MHEPHALSDSNRWCVRIMWWVFSLSLSLSLSPQGACVPWPRWISQRSWTLWQRQPYVQAAAVQAGVAARGQMLA